MRKMLKKIYGELILIRKELQAIRNNMESVSKIELDRKAIAQAVQKSSYDTFPEDGDTF